MDIVPTSDLLKICHEHEETFSGSRGMRQFECLIGLVENGSITSLEELNEYIPCIPDPITPPENNEGRKIIFSKFCIERDSRSCTVPLEDILGEIHANFQHRKQGYREGVVLVPVHPSRFIGQIVTLQDGDVLIGKYSRRKSNEDPRKSVKVAGRVQPDPLVAVDVVLYHRDILAEGKENDDISADWEVVTILTKISHEDQPMPPETLLYNHFKASGGTSTKMGDGEFIDTLKASFEFWKDKALIKR